MPFFDVDTTLASIFQYFHDIGCLSSIECIRARCPIIYEVFEVLSSDHVCRHSGQFWGDMRGEGSEDLLVASRYYGEAS